MTDADKVAHDTLLRELHNVDGLVETHSHFVLIISGGLLAYASSQIANIPMVIFFSIFGIFVALEWMLKVIRHRAIFRASHDKLALLESRLCIDAIRPLPKPHRWLRSFDGFTLLLWLSIAIMLFWAAFIVLRVRGVGLSAGTGGGTKVGSQVQNPPKPNLRQRFADLKDAYFDLESNDVRGDARAALTSNAELLKKIFGEFPDAVAVIEGHADDRGTRENNFGLGYRRATAAKEFLLQLGLPPAKLNTITLGKEKPQCVESNEECLARNRRVHFSP